MDGGIDWFMLAITVPLVPAMAIIGALFWLRAGRPKPDEVAGGDLDNASYFAAEPEHAVRRDGLSDFSSLERRGPQL